MRKFKHRITGNIAYKNKNGCNYILEDGTQFPETLPLWVIENSNDWEEIKEFPKIVSFRKISDKTLYTLGRYDLYWGKEVIGGYTLDVMITQGKNTNYTEIYQVAVSETEVFTLGDRVKYYGEVCNITGIYFNEHNQLSFRTNIKSLTVPKTGVFDLDVKYNKIKKASEVLFVTEDGVKVFEGDFHFSVNKKTLTLADNGTAQIGNSASHKDVWWTFSTKELAEKYVDENKPIYSRKQIKEALENSFVRENYILDVPCCCADRFKEELFNQKLGL